MWSDELRARIDRELGLTSYDIIGMTETGGPGLGRSSCCIAGQFHRLCASVSRSEGNCCRCPNPQNQD